jgi:CubicO group peptidase (beta-lactamase class C family)
MNGRRFVLGLVAVVVGCCAGVPGAVAQKVTGEWVEKVARPLVEKHVVDGLSVGFIEGEKFGIVHLGSANAAGEKADMLTVYELGSVSKVFTSLLLADAVVRGEIDLKAAAEMANPAGIRFSARDGRSITWLDLSTHRTGLPRLAGNFAITNPADPYREYDSKKAAEFLKGYQLPRKPGEAQEYSNFAVSVLGYLLATKAGKSYDQLLKERIAEPLKMTDCTVALNEEQMKRLATPHSRCGVTTPPWTFADMPGAGGVRATMRDMMRFAKAQLNPPSGKLGEAIELAWKQQTAADASGSAMGLGWMIAGDGQTRWHNGQVGGSHSAVFINRGLKCAVVVLCNTAAGKEIDKLASQVLLKAAGQDVEPEPTETADNDTKKLPIDAKLRGRLAGRYQLTPDFIFTVSDEDGHLMVGITNQVTQEVFPDSPTLWSYHGVDAKLEFKLPKTGSAPSLVLIQNGARQLARRMKGAVSKP